MIEPLVRHGEATARLWEARLRLKALGWRRALADSTTRDRLEPGITVAEIRAVERALWRGSRLVPGATCIHRALAGQKMLRRRGLPARVAMGLRKGPTGLEGHAWLEATHVGELVRLFVADDAGYKEVGWEQAMNSNLWG